MKLTFFVIASILICESSLGQDSIKVVRQYDNDKPITSADSAFHKVLNTIFISLDEGFDDSLYITVNDILFLNKYLKSNESIGYAAGFGIHFNDSSETKDLKIKFIKANRFIQERINLKYKSLQVRGLNPWLLQYSNRFPLRQ